MHRALAVAVALAGCATSAPALPPAAALLPRAPAEGQRCRVSSHASPLVTEWPASEKANLEALLRGGAVAVAYAGCSLRVLPQCRAAGNYRFQRTTPSTDVLEIGSEDELWAKLPLGAASLEGELKRSGKLAVRTRIAGQMKLEGAPEGGMGESQCAQATHVVAALSVGAFELSSGGSLSGGVSAGVAEVVGARAGASRSAGLLRSAGDPDACGQASAEAPHPNCASPIQVFLSPIAGRAAEESPPGTMRAEFVSGDASRRWDVYVDDRVVCTTPCGGHVRPERPVLLRAREDGFMGPADRVQVANLMPWAAEEHVQIAAHPTSNGKLVTGITFTSFGGMGVLAGVVLTALGCSSEDRPGLCTGGLISLGAGAVVAAGSIWLILDALPKAEIISHPHGTVVLGPTGIAGRF